MTDRKIYKISRIEGEYAYLAEEGCTEELFIAIALLPIGIDIGEQVAYENLEFAKI